MKINTELLKDIEKYTSELINNESSEDLVFHNIVHTKQVVENVKEIGKNEGLNDDEMNILIAAAWFHDTGYTKKYIGHEKESVAIAVRFLETKNVDKELIMLVSEAIMATMPTQKPISKISKILCDADLMHFGKENYFEIAEKLRQELKKSKIKKYKKIKFVEESVKFFKKHSYYTDYCRRELTKIKEKNFNLMQKKLVAQQLKNKKKSKVKVTKKYSRGVDSMFKLTARNQINLSSIADNKSNILISLNGIIISLGLTAIVGKFREEPALIIPTVIFIGFSLLTIILAILSTRPNISSCTFEKEDIKLKKINMLFFGNFHKMELDDYEWAIREMINDDKYLYSAMTKDQYFLGKVLAKKYKLLRWAYNVFMVGIVISTAIFLLVFLQL